MRKKTKQNKKEWLPRVLFECLEKTFSKRVLHELL